MTNVQIELLLRERDDLLRLNQHFKMALHKVAKAAKEYEDYNGLEEMPEFGIIAEQAVCRRMIDVVLARKNP